MPWLLPTGKENANFVHRWRRTFFHRAVVTATESRDRRAVVTLTWTITTGRRTLFYCGLTTSRFNPQRAGYSAISQKSHAGGI
ncbi:hypothetical protein KCP73_04120 [Salmonella enterica subsp. enterica]|nr:hypothetical protein KCP73_04120 [Salmonella enterica subsp. enterica]